MTEVGQEFVSRDTHPITGRAILDLTIPEPQDSFFETGNLTRSDRVLRVAQQILFLPRFSTTDHLFHGENIDSTDPRRGLPSTRQANVDGNNFGLFIFHNFVGKIRDSEQPLTRVDLHNRHGQGPYWCIHAGDGMVDPSAEDWLTNQVLTPILDELVIVDPPGMSGIEVVA